MSRLNEKIKEIEEYCSELEEVAPLNFEEYANNLMRKLACERALEKIIEGVNDLAILIIKEKRLPIPKEDIRAFEILLEKSIISKELAEKLKQAKGMRNILTHEYGKVDDEIIFEAIDKEILKDAHEFIIKIKEALR